MLPLIKEIITQNTFHRTMKRKTFNQKIWNLIPIKLRSHIAKHAESEALLFLILTDINPDVRKILEKSQKPHHFAHKMKNIVASKGPQLSPQNLVTLLDCTPFPTFGLFDEILTHIIENPETKYKPVLAQLNDKFLEVADNCNKNTSSNTDLKDQIFWILHRISVLFRLPSCSSVAAMYDLEMLRTLHTIILKLKPEKTDPKFPQDIQIMLMNILTHTNADIELKEEVWSTLYSKTWFMEMTSVETHLFLMNMASENKWGTLPPSARLAFFYESYFVSDRMRPWIETNNAVWRKDLQTFLTQNDYNIDIATMPLPWVEAIVETLREPTS